MGKVKRTELKVGDDVMTKGDFDTVDLDKQIGKIIKIGEYGNLLVEFEKSFNKLLHAGYKDIGKAKHCFYIPLENVLSNDKTKFEKLKAAGAYNVDDKQWWFANRPKKEESSADGKARKAGPGTK